MNKWCSIEGEVANLLRRIVLDEERFELPNLPPVIGGTWGDLALEGSWGPLSVQGPELVWEMQTAHGAAKETHDKLQAIDRLRNRPALLHLADGTRVRAEFGHWSRWGGRVGMQPGYTCEFNVWQVEGRTPARWTGKLLGGGFRNANLTVTGPRRSAAQNMRLQGRYTWYLLNRLKEEEHSVVVVDGGPSPLDHDVVGADFNALQVALGAPLQLDTLVAFDGPGNIVGCAGVHLGGNRPTKRRDHADGPVPDDFTKECWIPVFFQRLAAAMADEALPWGMVCNAYLDSISDSTIDSQYLKLHVALEAFSKGRDPVTALIDRETGRCCGSKGSLAKEVREVDQWFS